MADGDVEIPKVGKLPKKILIPLAVGLAGFVGWRYWQARNGAGADAGSTITDGEFGAVDSSIPGVAGAVSPTNSYGDSGNTGDGGVDDPTRFTNNAQWTDYVVGKLQQSDTWTYTDIVTAIGLGLAGKPTTDAQQAILRAALAIGGQPPSGAIVIVSGGNTPILIAPVGKLIVSRPDHLTFQWGPVSGADHYVLTQTNGGQYVATGTQYAVTGLSPNTSYTFKIAAATASGTLGPSSTMTGKTQATPSTAPKPAAGSKRGYGWHKVVSHESAASIAKNAGISLAAFYAYNGKSRIVAGEWVKTRFFSNPIAGYKGK